MIINWKKIFTFSFCGLMTTSSIANAYVGFSPAEHVSAGDNVKLYFSDNQHGKRNLSLTLPNGLGLTYGKILSMGDFYGTPTQPISQGKTEADKRARFLVAFNSFANNANAVSETQAIIGIIDAEKKYIEDGLKNGEKEEDLYAKQGLDYDRQFNCVTGGGCEAATWWTKPGRYLDLAKDNFDHFGGDAVQAYKIGHQVALEQAVLAYKTHDAKGLELAYAMNAFACHFLSDRFSTGHMRTPRKELYDVVTPSLVGSLLANFMHNEESAYGLHVYNIRGDKWIAYGDKSYYSEKSNEHRIKQEEAFQFSADQIFFAYQNGYAPNTSIDFLIPLPEEIGSASNTDVSPMFYWDQTNQKLMRRNNLKNVYDTHWTDNWWGWSTLTELGGSDMMPVLAQVELARSKWKNQALKAGLIKDKNVLAYLKTLK